MESMNQKIDSLYTRFDHLYDVCASAFKSAASQRSQPAAASADVDRSLNFVVFAVKEDRIADIWHHSVADILRYVSDHDIDAFRIGWLNPDKMRPVLVKLRVAWDKRLILSKRSKPKCYSQRDVSIAPDLPLEMRRKIHLNS
jgi:hypothetical protein